MRQWKLLLAGVGLTLAGTLLLWNGETPISSEAILGTSLDDFVYCCEENRCIPVPKRYCDSAYDVQQEICEMKCAQNRNQRASSSSSSEGPQFCCDLEWKAVNITEKGEHVEEDGLCGDVSDEYQNYSPVETVEDAREFCLPTYCEDVGCEVLGKALCSAGYDLDWYPSPDHRYVLPGVAPVAQEFCMAYLASEGSLRPGGGMNIQSSAEGAASVEASSEEPPPAAGGSSAASASSEEEEEEEVEVQSSAVPSSTRASSRAPTVAPRPPRSSAMPVRSSARSRSSFAGIRCLLCEWMANTPACSGTGDWAACRTRGGGDCYSYDNACQNRFQKRCDDEVTASRADIKFAIPRGDPWPDFSTCNDFNYIYDGHSNEGQTGQPFEVVQRCLHVAPDVQNITALNDGCRTFQNLPQAFAEASRLRARVPAGVQVTVTANQAPSDTGVTTYVSIDVTAATVRYEACHAPDAFCFGSSGEQTVLCTNSAGEAAYETCCSVNRWVRGRDCRDVRCPLTGTLCNSRNSNIALNGTVTCSDGSSRQSMVCCLHSNSTFASVSIGELKNGSRCP
jgi:hypothetical protein